jgi:hypothetical protein
MNDVTTPEENAVLQATIEQDYTPPQSFPAVVWNTLSRIDVADNIETAEVKKDGRVMYTYQYLSWSWAWAQLMKRFPESEYVIEPEDHLENGSVMVNTTVIVRDGQKTFARKMWLPVMNQANSSIQNPTSRQISDSRMRCLVKNLAILGLGLDLWAGSDIPVGSVDDPIGNGKLELLTGLFDKLDKDSQAGFLAWLDVPSVAEIKESQYQRARKQLERKVKEQGS